MGQKKLIETIPGFVRLQTIFFEEGKRHESAIEWFNVSHIIKFTELVEKNRDCYCALQVIGDPDPELVSSYVACNEAQLAEAIKEASKPTIYSPSGY